MGDHEAAYSEARRRLVDALVRSGAIRSAAIEAAFRDVPREAFVPPAPPAEIYADTVIPVAGNQGDWLTTSSQPAMMSLMLEQLGVRPGDRVLEIGAGTGYNAAILGILAGPGGAVHSVEYEPDAARMAARALEALGSGVHVHCADGADGWPPGAPYDRILATVAVWDLPDAWTAQAAPAARIVAPITILGTDFSVPLDRQGDAWDGGPAEACAFVRFKGRLASPPQRLRDDRAEPSVVFSVERGAGPPPTLVEAWLRRSRDEGVEGIDTPGAWEGFLFWLLATLGPERVIRRQFPARAERWTGHAIGLWDEEGMAFVTADGRLESFGHSGAEGVLRAAHAGWEAAGSPGLRAVRLRLVPGLQPPGPGRLPRWTHTIEVAFP